MTVIRSINWKHVIIFSGFLFEIPFWETVKQTPNVQVSEQWKQSFCISEAKSSYNQKKILKAVSDAHTKCYEKIDSIFHRKNIDKAHI